jgi:hypothetical protein
MKLESLPGNGHCTSSKARAKPVMVRKILRRSDRERYTSANIMAAPE